MKVIKVIVDELPEGCYLCDLMSYVSEGDNLDDIFQICHVTGKTLTDISKRPDWCPLVTENDANICTRCWKKSRKHMTVIPEGFKGAGNKMCDKCVEEVWGLIMDFDKDTEGEE